MSPDLTPEQRREADELSPILLDCFAILLASLEARLIDRQSDNPNEDIGKIAIIVDPDGVITGRISAQPRSVTSGFVLITALSKEAAYHMEQLLAKGAYDTQNIKTIIGLLAPKYANPDWAEDLEIAADEVAQVLVNAVALVPGLPMYALLREAAERSRSGPI